VPVRQWVLSLPVNLRCRLAYDATPVRNILQIFARAVFASLRRRTRRQRGIRNGKCGDAVYAEDTSDGVRFHRLFPPGDAEVARVTDRIVRRISGLLERGGLGPQADLEESDPLRRDQRLLVCGASVSGRIATGVRAGHRVSTMGGGLECERLAVAK